MCVAHSEDVQLAIHNRRAARNSRTSSFGSTFGHVSTGPFHSKARCDRGRAIAANRWTVAKSKVQGGDWACEYVTGENEDDGRKRMHHDAGGIKSRGVRLEVGAVVLRILISFHARG